MPELTPEERIARHKARREAGFNSPQQELTPEEARSAKTILFLTLGISGIIVASLGFAWAQQQLQQKELEKRAETNARQIAERTEELRAMSEQYREEITQLNGPYMRFVDDLKVASATGRIALSGPVGRMQQSVRELREIQTGECLQQVQSNIAEGMTTIINGFITFMDADNPDDDSTSLIAKGSKLMKESVDWAPNCTDIAYLENNY